MTAIAGVLVTLVLGVAAAQIIDPPPTRGVRPRLTSASACEEFLKRLPPELRAEFAESHRVLDTLRKELGLHGLRMMSNSRLTQVALENWRQPMTPEVVVPTARRVTAALLRVDPAAVRRDSVSIQISDYVPQVVRLTWKTSEFAAHPGSTPPTLVRRP